MASSGFTPRRGRYSCDSAEQTLEWMAAIAAFLQRFRPLVDAHVVNFFKDRLWELVDAEWMDCLRKEPIRNLLRFPSGFVMEHWPDSLQKFIQTIDSLVMPRKQELLNKLFPDIEITTLDAVLVQGMNPKKKHEIEILSALVNTVAHSVGAEEIIDVGAGQGYLAQVLCFQYQHLVTAIDASQHHSAVTSERAKRIKKHYVAKLLKSREGNGLGGIEKEHLHGPQTVTCRVLSSNGLSTLTTSVSSKVAIKHAKSSVKVPMVDYMEENKSTCSSSNHEDAVASIVLAGLHACGDLSVNMLRAFVDSEQVKALVCIGCCYNLLSEECSGDTVSSCGFPMSAGAKSHGISFQKNARDLSCQCADRWETLSESDAIQNFQLHAFRAAFQMVLGRYFPQVLTSCPSIGRQGKALRRRRMRRVIYSELNNYDNVISSHNGIDCCQREDDAFSMKPKDPELADQHQMIMTSSNNSISGSNTGCFTGEHAVDWKGGFSMKTYDNYELFEEFCKNGFDRLGCDLSTEADLHGIWNNTLPFLELVGPFWSLRAALGPLLETYLLLDRLLFLQEQHDCSKKVMMFPVFDPVVSPRNIVIVALK